MGSWRERRRFFRRKRSPTSPPVKYNLHDPLPEFWQDGVPLWEKKFCTSTGRVPWQKIVDAKNLMVCHSNVLSWNDSGAKEAFDKAKKVYWEKINNIHYDNSPPHPDIYLEDIDWDCYIDPELVKELELEYFAPPEDDEMMYTRNKRTKSSPYVAQEVNGENSQDFQSPWESDRMQKRNPYEIDNMQKSNPWESDNIQKSNPLESDNMQKSNPWESDNMQTSRALETCEARAWDNFDDKSCDLDNQNNPWECSNSFGNIGLFKNVWKCPGTETHSWGRNQVTSCSRGLHDVKSSRDHHYQGFASSEEKSWGNSVFDTRDWKRQNYRSGANNCNNWDTTVSRNKVAYEAQKDREWQDKSTMSCWKLQENKGRCPKDSGLRRNYGGWRSQNDSYLKRDESHPYPSEACSRFQAEYPVGQGWGRGSKKRVGFSCE